MQQISKEMRKGSSVYMHKFCSSDLETADSELLLESVYIMKVVDLIFMNLMSIVTLTACHLTRFHSTEILAF